MSLPDSVNFSNTSSSQLQALQTSQGNYCLLELDYTPKLAEILGLALEVESNVQLLEKLTTKLALVAQEHVTGLVLDPVYSFLVLDTKLPNRQNTKSPASIFRLEALNTEVDPLATPVLINNWSIEDIKNNYATAKIELLYHPAEEKALEKKQMVAELYDYCQYQKIPFLLKLVIYTPADEEFNPVLFQEAQLTAAQEFRGICDILALQYPQDALAVATLTAELDIPWLFMAEGVNYDDYKDMLRTSLENGARGFMVGGVLWQEFANLKKEDESPDMEAINKFIETTFRDRLIEIVRIVEETYVENT